MKRRVVVSLVPALAVFFVVLGMLLNQALYEGANLTRLSAPPDWLGIAWPVGFPLFAALVAAPVFVVALGGLYLFDRVRRA